jgi:hypothetical protein
MGVKDVDFILKNSDGSTTLCQVKSARHAHYKVRWYARVSPQRLTGLAVLIAGRKRAGQGTEWRSHLSGETGWGLPRDQQVREAAGFVRAAVRYRLQDAADLVQDAADLAWRPVDAILGSRELSNLIVTLVTLIVAVISIHGAGLYGLVNNLANVAVVPAFALAMIHGGRRYRQVKPVKRKPRRKGSRS